MNEISNNLKTVQIIGKMLDGIFAEDDASKRRILVEEFQIFSYAVSVGIPSIGYSSSSQVTENFSNTN